VPDGDWVRFFAWVLFETRMNTNEHKFLNFLPQVRNFEGDDDTPFVPGAFVLVERLGPFFRFAYIVD
jgi:hypothetical protein